MMRSEDERWGTPAEIQQQRLLKRIAEAIEKRQTIVPIFVFVPQNVSPHHIESLATHVTEALRRAGLDVPSRPVE